MQNSQGIKWLIGLAVVAAGGYGIWHANQPKPVSVSTAIVSKGLVERSVSNTRVGTVEACLRAKMSFSTGGQIAAINVKEGQVVEKDTVLMELWNQDLKASLAEVKVAVESARLDQEAVCINAQNSRREANRLNRLAQKQLVSEEAADHAESQARSAAASCAAARAREHQAEARILVAEAALEKTRLSAPFTGIIAEIKGEVGEYTTPSPPGIATPPAIDMLTNDCHYVTAPIDEVDAGELSIGQTARISFDAYRGQSFNGTIARIDPYVLDLEKQARTVEVEVHFGDKLAVPLLAGYSADVEIILDRAETP